MTASKLAVVLLIAVVSVSADRSRHKRCADSVTVASGSHAPSRFCSGDLIFQDNFKTLDYKKWQHENTLGGGGNWEFQWYNNNRTNSYVHNDILYITPSLLSDQFGEEFLTSGTLNVEGGAPADRCTNPLWYGCERTGTPEHILNPIKSARLRTVNSFSFRYGKVEVKAKMPVGDWLWPAIWLMPADNSYGTWPASGEIDLMESRGNRQIFSNNVNVGVEQSGSTLHFGPYSGLNGWEKAHWVRNDNNGYHTSFKKYQLEWTPDYLKFSIDDVELGRIAPDDNGFWSLGGFDQAAPGTDNPWRYGTKMAPFDQEFYLIINLAIGGTNYFADDLIYPGGKPWSNNSPRAMTDFWNGRGSWLPTWTSARDVSLQVDHVKIWAL